MDTNPTPPNKETVSQSDVEGLLAQIGGSAAPVQTAAPAAEKAVSQPSVFRRLSSFSATELRKLSVRHEEFIRSLSARLSGHLRLEVGIKISRLDVMPFEKLIGELSNPAYLALVRLEPLQGTCLLEIPPQLGLSIVDRELGGPGECLDQDRPLTEIESRILSRIADIALNEWCTAWSDLLELRPMLLAHESNGAFVQDIALDTVMLVLGLEVQMGELTKQIHFSFPYSTLEPLIQKLDIQPEAEKKPVAKTTAALPKWNPALNDVNVHITAELPGLEVATSELAKLKPGDVIPLDPQIFQHVRVSLAKKQKFIATIGRCGPRWAAKITKVLDPLQDR
jgi:flagellar motor switch protein FliM